MKSRIRTQSPTFLRRALAPNGRLPLSAASVWVLAAGGVLAFSGAIAAPPLPAPGVRISPVAVPTGAATQPRVATVAGTPVYAPQVVNGNFATYQVAPSADNSSVTATIRQNSATGILQWSAFDIGSKATVNIVQPSTQSVLLNKVSGGGFGGKTLIEGALNANGQVYISNGAGIIFGKSAVIDVNSLVATTLKIDNERFIRGLLVPTDVSPQYILETDATGAPLGRNGEITVEGERVPDVDANGTQRVDAKGKPLFRLEQARIGAAVGGKVMLLAPNVNNNGAISAPDGQVVLAAGGKIYLASPNDLSMRGLLVEVDNGFAATAGRVDSDSVATNGTIGSINVGRGNASMVARAVNQNGVITATTAVTANGSIWLHARDGAQKDSEGAAKATASGPLEIGPGSVMQILPDSADTTTTTAATTFYPSQVDLAGSTVHLAEGASILAPAGNVTITARVSPQGASPGSSTNNNIVVDAKASINVAGQDTQKSMESNVIQVELRGTELADNPLLRDSPLRGQTVSVDKRVGTRVGNIKGWLDLVEFGIGERSAAGGNVTFRADGEVRLAKDSTVDVSGGKVGYGAGKIVTSKLISDGRLYDIGTAPADRVYSGIQDIKQTAAVDEAAYSEGRNAGTIIVDSTSARLEGSLAGRVSPGERQRATGINRPVGGALLIGNDETQGNLGQADSFHFNDSVTFVNNPVTTGGTGTGLKLDLASLGAEGFSRFTVYTQRDVSFETTRDGTRYDATIKKDVTTADTLAPGSQIAIAASGTINFESVSGASSQSGAGIRIAGGRIAAASSSGVQVGAGVQIDVSGAWTNDRVVSVAATDARGVPVSAITTKGGSISLSAPQVAVGDRAAFDVSGGAWQNSAGAIGWGAAGSVVLGQSVSGATSPSDLSLALGQGVQFRGYGMSAGGSLRLNASEVQLKSDRDFSAPLTAGTLDLRESFFRSGGFTNFDIRAAGNVVIDAGIDPATGKRFPLAQVAPQAASWVTRSDTRSTAGGRMSDAFGVGTLPVAGPAAASTPASLKLNDALGNDLLKLTTVAGARPAASLSLTAAGENRDASGRVLLQSGSSITVDPGASVTVNAGRQITLGGGDAAGTSATGVAAASITAHGGTIALGLTPGVSSASTYRADRSVWLGANAVLDASGSAEQLWPDGRGITKGNLLAGGNVRIGNLGATALAPAAGYVVAEAGSRIDVSGAAAQMTLAAAEGGVATREVASNGGSIEMRARDGILFGGIFAGRAGNTTASGGSLAMVLDRTGLSETGASTGALDLRVFAAAPAGGIVAAGLAPNAPINGFGGTGQVLASAFNSGGFDWISLRSNGTVSFDAGGGNLALAARSGLLIDAPGIMIAGAHALPGGAPAGSLSSSVVSLTAPYVQLGSTDWRNQTPAAASAGAAPASLQVVAGTIDLTGQTGLVGVGRADLQAAGDVRLVGQVPIDLTQTPATLRSLNATGQFSVNGALEISASQVYPTTMSEFTLAASGAQGKIGFSSNGTVPAPGLPSAAGSLTVKAPDIAQNGVVRAPFGRIAFNADNALTFGATSVTSVAGKGAVPLGLVQNGRDWVYDFGAGNTVNLTDAGAANYMALPEKGIATKGAAITTNAGAVLDASGGGVRYAYEFTPGPGGTTDVLKSSAAAPAFALIRGFTGAVAPRDMQYGQDGGLKVGDRVYLSGGPGLPAGFYTLLPAHYALLDTNNGFLVTPLANTSDMPSVGGVTRPDGSLVVSGYRASIGGGADNRRSGFVVSPYAVLRARSEFRHYFEGVNADTGSALPSVATLARASDGGHVTFDVTQSLTLEGSVRLAGASMKDRRGIVDISAPEIAIVADRAQARPAESAANAVLLTAGDLNALGADSLSIGAVRSDSAAGEILTVGARQVVVANNAANPLSAPEIIIAAAGSETTDANGKAVASVPAGANTDVAANGRVLVKAGATVLASGTPSHQSTADTLLIRNKGNPATLGADGALVRVSNGAQVLLNRNAVQADGTTAGPAGVTGTLEVKAGASLKAAGALAFDATKSSVIETGLTQGSANALSVGGNRISLGSSAPLGVAGLRFDDEAIAGLNQLSNLSLTSYSTLDMYDTVNLGGGVTKNITLSANAIRGIGVAGVPRATVSAAQTLRLEGIAGAVAGPVVTSGSLDLKAANIDLGGGTMAATGFGAVTLNAANDLRATGTGASFSSDNQLTLAAARVTARGGSDAMFQAGGQLRITRAGEAGSVLPASEFGGKLGFKGATINAESANVEVASGQVSFAASNGVNIMAAGGSEVGSSVSVAGNSVAFGSAILSTPGGRISVDGGTGNVLLDARSRLVASATGADAGTIAVKANNTGRTGEAVLLGTLKGDAGASADGVTPAQGSFTMDVDRISAAQGFGVLNARLNDGGFGAARDFRVRGGDVNLLATGAGGPAESIVARQVTIAADNGNLNIGGTVDARGAEGGSIRLFAAESSAGKGAGQVNLAASARLLASANVAAAAQAGSIGDGGSIVLGSATSDGSAAASTADASIKVAAGAILDVSANGVAGQGGTVVLRAPRVAANNDAAVAGFGAANVLGSRSTSIEGYKVYAASTVSSNADSATNLNAGTAGKMFTESTTFSNGGTLARLGLTGSAVTLTPGLEIRSSGTTGTAANLSVSVNESAATNVMGTRGWNLATWRFKGQPIGLTLRAAGDLVIAGSISDGFTASNTIAMPDWRLATAGSSASYRLVGGADVAAGPTVGSPVWAANPLATAAGTSAGDVRLTFARLAGSATDRQVALVRTGTGTIDVAAGRDVVLDTIWMKGTATTGTLISQTAGGFSGVDFTKDTLLGASIYTAGVATNQPVAPAAGVAPTDTQFTAPTNVPNPAYRPANAGAATSAQFGDSGGAITIKSARNVVGSPTSQLFNNWLFRQGLVDAAGAFASDAVGLRLQATAWWSRPDYFNQGIATFAGGDISVVADSGKISDLSASVATNAYMPGTRPVAGALVERGGGDLTVRAGGDIQGGSYYVQKGQATLRADGAITAGVRKVLDPTLGPGVTVGVRPVLALGDAQVNVTAGKDVQIEGAFNPMMGMQSVANVSSRPSLASTTVFDQFSFFSTYSPDSAVRLTSLTGNVILGENASAMYGAGGGTGNSATSQLVATLDADFQRQYLLQPGSVSVAALGGDIRIEHGFSLWPSSKGQFGLYAKGSVTLADTALTGVSQPIVMIDRDPARMPNPLSPRVPVRADFATETYTDEGIAYHTDGGLHKDDTNPARIVALNGDIDFSRNTATIASVVLPKVAEFSAGRDIRNLGFRVQNLSESDVTRVSAGRDFVDSTFTDQLNKAAHIVTGPGRVDISAGRNIDLGNGGGVQTRGNIDNRFLPEQGASINLVAGATPDYTGFAKAYVKAGDLSADDQAALVAYVRQAAPSLAPEKSATAASAWIAFNEDLNAAQRAPFLEARRSQLNAIFFSAQAAALGISPKGSQNLVLFDDIIGSLFPVEKITGGDINVAGSQLRTERGGAIATFSPGGSTFAGLADQPLWLAQRLKADPTLVSKLGVFTIGGGAIQALVHDDYNVNQGRVFSLGGGDITLVSQFGNIDAGKGAKTAVSAPPPLITTDQFGNTKVDISGSIAGSGIATLRTSPSVPASSVYILAPRGYFDPGDAGIRSTGDLKTDGDCKANCNNIAFGGTSTVVQKSSDVQGGPSGAAPAAAPVAKSDSFAAAGAVNPDAATSLTVDLLGYGPSAASPGAPQGATSAQPQSPAASGVRPQSSGSGARPGEPASSESGVRSGTSRDEVRE